MPHDPVPTTPPTCLTDRERAIARGVFSGALSRLALQGPTEGLPNGRPGSESIWSLETLFDPCLEDALLLVDGYNVFDRTVDRRVHDSEDEWAQGWALLKSPGRLGNLARAVMRQRFAGDGPLTKDVAFPIRGAARSRHAAYCSAMNQMIRRGQLAR